MHLFIAILHLSQVVRLDLFPQDLQHITIIKLFGVPSIFVLKFFGELFLLFAASALISHVLKIDRASRD
jgi:hypothetical protein